MIIMNENDIPKYKKKTKSNVSKSQSKAKHKHQNKECLLEVHNNLYIANYCAICGKISNWNICLEKCGDGCYRELNREEILEKYKDIDKFAIDDLLVKYVPIN